MLEVLSLQYDATDADPALLVTIPTAEPTVLETGQTLMVRQLGAPNLRARIPISSLTPEHRKAFAELLAVLIPLVQKRSAEAVSDPAALAQRASELAAREQEMARTETAHHAAVAQARAELERVSQEGAARMAALEQSLSAKRAEVEALMTEKGQ